MKALVTLLVLITGVMVSSCQEREAPSPPVKVEFHLTDAEGKATTIFQEGEDILFDYSIVNLIDETVTWYFDSAFSYHNMFTVYKVEEPGPERPGGDVVKIGTPQTPVLQIDARTGRVIPANGEMRILMSWTGNRENTYMFDNWSIYYHERESLTPGKYFVEFEQGITFALYNPFHRKFKIDFEVRSK
ncbi:hypothetical protein [Algoriphagus sp.]|uniref:hypothetical protein n=1 Tax=Algoriphagus sp. TaxID=1872435 RepID=UPI003F72DF5E